MTITLAPRPLTREHFSPFGEVIQTEGAATRLINSGTCTRFHALASVEARGGNARVVVNLFRAEPTPFPARLRLMERHPLGSQAFWPLADRDWLVAVAPDEEGRPGPPQVFRASGRQGVCYAPGTWHHPVIALHEVCDFLVIDRDGPGANLEEADYPTPFLVRPGDA